MARKEADVEADVVKWTESQGGYAPKLVIFNEVGFPDRTLLLPDATILFPELKHPNGRGRHRHMQDVWAKRLTRLGFHARFCKSLEEVKGMVRKANYK